MCPMISLNIALYMILTHWPLADLKEILDFRVMFKPEFQ